MKNNVLSILAIILSLGGISAFGYQSCAANGADRDRDGVPDTADLCPSEPAGAARDNNRAGCPLRDSDRDGITDDVDVCPGVPVTQATNDSDRNGCPLPPTIPAPTPNPLPVDGDYDSDGVRNDQDQCATVAKGDNADPEREGCPDGDSDGDGVTNHSDRCPQQASSEANDPDSDGCPNADRDRDGVIDETDQCPDLPETNPDAGTSDNDGGTDGDASTTDAVTNPHPGCPIGHEPTVVADGGTNNDASAAAIETDAASSGNDTEVVQAAPAPAASSESTTGNAVMLAIDDAAAATRFCTLDRRALAAIQLAGASECAQGEKFCFRLVNSEVMPTACDPRTPAPGCVTAGGSMNVCRPGAEAVMVVRYGASLQDRTPAGVAAAVTAQSQPRRHASRHRGPSRHGIAFGWGNVSVY